MQKKEQGADIKDHFLAPPIDCPEYMHVKHRHVLPNTREKYNLQNILTQDEYIYIKIKRGMYGLF